MQNETGKKGENTRCGCRPSALRAAHLPPWRPGRKLVVGALQASNLKNNSGCGSTCLRKDFKDVEPAIAGGLASVTCQLPGSWQASGQEPALSKHL